MPELKPLLALAFVALLLAQSAPQIDAGAEVAAVLYAAQATQKAALQYADAELRARRTEIERLQANAKQIRAQLSTAQEQYTADRAARDRAHGQEIARLQASANEARQRLTTAQEKYVSDLAARDRAYAQEIAMIRAAAEKKASTPEGAAALARFNAGDVREGLDMMDALDAARDQGRLKRAAIEKAADRRETAILALDASARGKTTNAEVLKRFEEVTKLDPGLASDWLQLAGLYRDAGTLSDAGRAAAKAAETATTDREREAAYMERGNVLLAQGDGPGADSMFGKALEIAQALVSTAPDDTGLQYDLSVALALRADAVAARDRPGALSAYRKALEIREGLVEKDPTNSFLLNGEFISHLHLGDMLLDEGNGGGALDQYSKGLAIMERMTRADPENLDWLRELSASYERVGGVQEALGMKRAALDSYREELNFAARVAAQDRGNSQWQRDEFIGHSKVGDVFFAMGNIAGALLEFQSALKIVQALTNKDPANSNWQRDLALSHDKVGDGYLKLNEVAAALESYREAKRIVERLRARDQSNSEWQSDLSQSHEKVGDALKSLGRQSEAHAEYEAGLKIREDLAARDPGSAALQRDLIVIYVRMAEVMDDKEYVKKALAVALDMQRRGILAPRDYWMIDRLKGVLQ